MSTIRTAPPRTYLPPGKDEMREMAQHCEVQKFSADLVEDFCNLAAGGEILPPSAYRLQVGALADRKVSQSPTKDYYGTEGWQLPNGSLASTRTEAVQAEVERGMKGQQAVCDFLQTVDLAKFPGASPLEQAMNLLKLLATQSGGSGDGSEGVLPIFLDESPEEVGERLNDIMDDVESLSSEEQELLESDQDAGSGDSDHADDDLQRMRLAEDMVRGKDLWLKVSRQLDRVVRMRVAKSVKVKPHPDGDEVRTRPIESFSELTKIRPTAWATYQRNQALFWYQAATRQLPVRERVRREVKRQLLYVIVDCSGSMANGRRIQAAGGVVFNRLKAVVAGEAEIYVRFFDSKLHTEHHASNAAEAKGLMRKFTENNFSGGSTAISACALQAQARIEEIVAEGRTTRPELVIVTDGDDTITATAADFPGTKVHAFVVGESNARLTDLAVKSGGVGIDRL